MDYMLLLPIIVSLLTTLLFTPIWIKMAKRAGLISKKDMHKLEYKHIVESGGLVVMLGFILGLFVYIALRTFYFKDIDINLQIMALSSTVILVALVGFVDDILGWKIGLRQYQKPILTLIAAFPIMVVNAGHSSMYLPFLGVIQFGYWYPLLIIPIAIVGAANAFNLIAGYNGLETGLGIIILSTLGYVGLITGMDWQALICFIAVAALIAFYFFNKFPAIIFPGDALTYFVGALIAVIAIFGDLEKVALFLFIPYFFEFFLKMRGKLQKQSYAKLNPDGTLDVPYRRFYGLEHLTIWLLKRCKGKVYEVDVVYFLYTMEIALAIIVIALY